MKHSFVAVIALLGFSASFAQQPGPPSLVPENASKKISSHVYIIPDNNARFVPNVGIVVGSKATLIVDTGMGVRNAQTIMREVNKISSNKDLYLVATHFHPEHDLGAHGFPAGVKMLRSKDQLADIKEFGLQLAETFKKISPLNAELLEGADFRKADIIFENEHTLDLGGVKVRFMAMGPNHTRGDTAMWVEGDAVLFSGDVVMLPAPSFASPYSNVAHWQASLDKLEKLQPKLIVPSHGPTGGVELIAKYREYFKQVQARAADLKKQGKSVDETVQTLTPELGSFYADTGRIGGAIRAAYAEAK